MMVTGPDDPESDDGIVRASISPSPETSELEFLELVAGLEGVDIEGLPPLYTEIDHFLELLYRDPPAARAQVAISFSYAGYRVKVDQSGAVELVAVKESMEDV